MAKNKADTPESVIASADAENSHYSKRKYQGAMATGVDVSSNEGNHTTSVPKHPASGDPTVQAAPSRRQTSVERNGATYKVIAGINKPVDPAVSGQTMANGRVLRPAMNRSGSFGEGASA